MESMPTLKSIDAFRDVLKDPAKVATKWKSQGKKVVGYRCLFVPEEIIWAAGMLPYPLYGTPEPIRLADSYFQSCSCEFVRNLFDQALEGKLDFLDYLALSNTCDASRRVFDHWNQYITACPAYLINNPQKLLDETNREYYMTELTAFKQQMEELSGKQITDAGIRDAIELYNETRALLKELCELRKQNPPLITGEEALDVSMAAILMPKDQANPLLQQLLNEVREREVPENDGPRILVTGSTLDNPVLIRMIEEEGGQVVIDDLCTTSRYFWDQVDNAGDPMESLYRFLNRRALCACLHPMEARFDHLFNLIDEYDIEAVIDFNLKYCNPFMYEAPLLRKELEARDIPFNVLEIGHDMSGHGQLRTRIQAFIEMIEF